MAWETDLEPELKKLVELVKTDPETAEEVFTEAEQSFDPPRTCDGCGERIGEGDKGLSIFYPHLCKRCGLVQRAKDIAARRD